MEKEHLNKDEYILGLEARIQCLERRELIDAHVFPYNAWITLDSVNFCYDLSQRKELEKNDKMVFEIKTLTIDSYKKFLQSNFRELELRDWVCVEGGEGYYETSISKSKWNECFKSRLSECLHRMIESDNELKLSLLKRNKFEFHQRNR